MIASLPMYDLPGLGGAHDRLWAAMRARLGEGPQALLRGADVWDTWTDPDLLVSQTCGLPYRARLHDRVTLVGTPDYGVEGAAPGHYRSVIVVAGDGPMRSARDLDGGRMAYNEALSQSGWAAPQGWMAAQGIAPGGLIRTGAHAASARAVAAGEADFAALDWVTWALLRDAGRDGGLRVLAMTDPTPGLPLITAPGRDAQAIRAAFAGAVADLSGTDRRALRLHGIVEIPASDYLALPLPVPPETAD